MRIYIHNSAYLVCLASPSGVTNPKRACLSVEYAIKHVSTVTAPLIRE